LVERVGVRIGDVAREGGVGLLGRTDLDLLAGWIRVGMRALAVRGGFRRRARIWVGKRAGRCVLGDSSGWVFADRDPVPRCRQGTNEQYRALQTEPLDRK
jgi:hypothetical protein